MNEEDASKRQSVSQDASGTLHPARGTATAFERYEPVACERCGAAMFRVHAVWRCPTCGFKTDCCGW